MNGIPHLESLFRDRGFSDFKWLDPKKVVVSEWVRLKCMFGCTNYGRAACCPPNTLPLPDCRRLFDEYARAVVFHFQKQMVNPEDRHAWGKEVNHGLLQVEREVFLAGYYKVFLLLMASCHLCADCVPDRVLCKDPSGSRPTPEGVAVDVFATVRPLGYPIEVLDRYDLPMNRYAFLLVE